MNCLDCCSSIMSCDCCSIAVADCCDLNFECDCCSASCCPDCCGTGGLPGGIKFGEGLSLDGDTLNVTILGGSDYVLPTASETLKGGIKVGHSLLMTDESLNVALDTVPSTIEGFMWIHDVGWSVDPFGEGHFTKEDVDGVFS